MKNECSIVRDQLPLYTENMVSPDTAEFVEEHLKTCAGCRKEAEQSKEPEPVKPRADIAPLMDLRRKMRKKKIRTIAVSVILAAALLVSAFAFMSAPEYFPYADDLMTVTENADHSVSVTFDEKVTDYACRYYLEQESGDAQPCYDLEAWTSLWDRVFSHRGVQSTTIKPEQGLPITVYYLSNNGEADTCVYGDTLTESSGRVTLPRLVLDFYLVLAFAAVVVLLILWFVFRRRESTRIWITRIMMAPVSYLFAHLIVKGFRSVTYSAQRDFALIVFLAVLIFCGLLLIHSIIRLRKELRENGEA